MASASFFQKGSDEYTDAKCVVCEKQKNKQVIADYYCHDCQKHMCTSCLGMHNYFNDNHKVVKGKVDDKDVLTEKCGKHSDEFITVYCRQHDALLCRQCQLLEHRSVVLHKQKVSTFSKILFFFQIIVKFGTRQVV